MLNTAEEQTFRLEFADHRLADEAHPPGVLSQPWRVSQLELVQLALEGDAQARRLCMWVDVLLLGSAPDAQRPMRLQLVSEAWTHVDAWPPCHKLVTLAPVHAGNPSEALAYQVTEVIPGDQSASREGFWQTFLESTAESAAPKALPDSSKTVCEAQDLLSVIGDWMTTELRVDTVGGALRCVEFGEAGFFGPLKRVVLRRSTQADLEVDATRLGEVSDADEMAGEASLVLELYGDRHGAWLLHRRRLLPRSKRRNEADTLAIYDCDVLIADGAAELVALAGLGRLEKRLFQTTGILPNGSLRDHYAASSPSAEPGTKLMDLTTVPDRSRRFLEAIVALAVAGKLSTTDLDLMLRTARQLARANR